MKETGKIEESLSTILRISNFCVQNHVKQSPKLTKITRSMIDSLHDPEAKVANRFTLCRIPLGLSIPIVANFSKSGLTTLALTTFYALSDFIDGFYAKKIVKHPTEGGKYLDAMCDKIGFLELLIPAVLENPGLLVNGVLEGIIAKTNIDSTYEEIDVSSTNLGRLKMWPLSMALICTYMSKSGLKVKDFEITKEQFKTLSSILIPIAASLEAINVMEYNNIKNENKVLKKSKR